MIIDFKNDSFFKNLKQLNASNNWHSALHSQSAFNFYSQRPLDEGKEIEDCSFILNWEGQPLIGFLGAVVKSDNMSDILFGEIPCIGIESSVNLSKKAVKYFLNEFDRRINKINGRVWFRDYMIGGVMSNLTMHLLKKALS